jgi:hypothetical protein
VTRVVSVSNKTQQITTIQAAISGPAWSHFTSTTWYQCTKIQTTVNSKVLDNKQHITCISKKIQPTDKQNRDQNRQQSEAQPHWYQLVPVYRGHVTTVLNW